MTVNIENYKRQVDGLLTKIKMLEKDLEDCQVTINKLKHQPDHIRVARVYYTRPQVRGRSKPRKMVIERCDLMPEGWIVWVKD